MIGLEVDDRLDPAAGHEHLAGDLGVLRLVGVEQRVAAEPDAEKERTRDGDGDERYCIARP
jgi:hypothetical protein